MSDDQGQQHAADRSLPVRVQQRRVLRWLRSRWVRRTTSVSDGSVAQVPDPDYRKATMEKVMALVTCALDTDADAMAPILAEVITQREFIDIVAMLALMLSESTQVIALLKGLSTEEVWRAMCLDIDRALNS